MIRLTLTLLAGIFAVLSVAGREIAVPAAGDDVEVARAETDLAATTGTGRLALDDERGAIERALSAASASASGAEARPSDLLRSRGGTDPGETETALGEAAVVNADRVNLRAGPSTANLVLDQVVRDQQVRVLETDADGWSRISVPATGLEAWIFGRFLSPLG